MWHAITSIQGLDTQKIIDAWNVYMKHEGHHISQKEFLQNMDLKMAEKDFLHDIDTLLHPSFRYDIIESYQIVRTELLEKL